MSCVIPLLFCGNSEAGLLSAVANARGILPGIALTEKMGRHGLRNIEAPHPSVRGSFPVIRTFLFSSEFNGFLHENPHIFYSLFPDTGQTSFPLSVGSLFLGCGLLLESETFLTSYNALASGHAVAVLGVLTVSPLVACFWFIFSFFWRSVLLLPTEALSPLQISFLVS